MQIIGTILFIVLIILLIALALVFFLLTILLFCPIRYVSKGTKTEEDKKICAKIIIYNSLFYIKVTYEETTRLIVRVLGIKVYDIPPKKPKHKAKSKKDTPKTVQKDMSQETSRKTVKTDSEGPLRQGVPEQTKKANSNKIMIEKVVFFYNICKEEQQTIFSFITECFTTLKKIMPYYYKVKAKYGTGEADSTGYIYGLYSAMEACIGDDIVLEPVWLEKTLEGEYTMKGRIRIIFFVMLLAKVLTNKSYRDLYKRLKGGFTYGRT